MLDKYITKRLERKKWGILEYKLCLHYLVIGDENWNKGWLIIATFATPWIKSLVVHILSIAIAK